MFAGIKRIFPHISRSTKLALIVRGDIKMSKGKTAAQCSHASVLCYEKSLKSNPQMLHEWCQTGQPKIVLKIDHLEDLEVILEKAKEMNIIAEVVRDAGRTELTPGTTTVMGLGPDYVEKIDTLVKHLKLL